MIMELNGTTKKSGRKRYLGIYVLSLVTLFVMVGLLAGVREPVLATYCCDSECNTCDCCMATGGCQCSDCDNCCTNCDGTGGCSGCCQTGCSCPGPVTTCPWFTYQCACNNNNDCTPGCSCTPPACDAGYTTTVLTRRDVEPCIRRKTCDCTDDCGDTETDTRVCYLINDPNSPPPDPTSMVVCYGSPYHADATDCYALSKDRADPTIIRMPGASESFYVKVNWVENPSWSRGMRYLVRVNNETAGGWSGDCNNMYTGDWCNASWAPEWYSINLRDVISLAPGSFYSTWGHNATLNYCDNNLQCSRDDADPSRCASTVGYFQINQPPTFVSVTPDNVLSGTNTDVDNGPGCSDNNARNVVAEYSDPDGCDDLERVYFWIDDVGPDARNIGRSLHGLVQLGGDDIWRMYGLRYDSTIGRTCCPTCTGTCCYLNYLWDLAGGPVPKNVAVCSP